MTSIEVLATGPLTTVQDLGRPGHACWGVPPSGAADRGALRLGNRLVGNEEGAAALEVVLGGLRVRAHTRLLVAVTGAACPVELDGRAVGRNAPIPLPAGAELTLGTAVAGLRAYVALRGGVAVEPVLGSRATDLLSGLGPAPLRPGALLAIGPPGSGRPEVDLAPAADPATGELTVRVRRGPRDDWFTPAAVDRLASAAWTVSTDSDRIGVRLDGPPLERAISAELPTEGMVRGAVQVPPTGRPTILLADHPVTGGYPVIATVLDADVDLVAQARPGQPLRLAPVAP